ncbi:MAG: D-amino-acid transaminase [Bauldia sp.]
MARIAYVDGRYVPLRDARVHVEDRGYQFADGVYEVCEVRGGRLVDEALHMARLARSLGELRIVAPMQELALRTVMREVVRRNRVSDGLLYLQVTRGVAPRAHAFPSPAVRSVLVITVRRTAVNLTAAAATGIAVVTVPENRWARVDIKTVSLLPNVLAKQAAKEAGAAEAWFVDAGGYVNEGSSSNAWIVTRDGELVTAPTDAPILRGVTRTVALRTAQKLGLKFSERRFTVDEAHAAAEAFVTSATQLVMPVTTIDGRTIGNGEPGFTATALRKALLEETSIAPDLASPVAP